MTAVIVNAAPMTRMLGTLDKSIRALFSEAEALPTHLPKFYIYAEEGLTSPQLVVGSGLTSMFGENSFDVRQKWANHATVLCKLINAQGNAMMVQRLKPADAAPPATIRVFLDVLATKVPVYLRNEDGSIKTDENGPVLDGVKTVDGFKAKWVIGQVEIDQDGNDTFGQATQRAGDQVDGATQSKRYPMFDLRVSSFGAHGNNKGIKIWAPTNKSSMPLDDRLLASRKVYPFRMACVKRPNDATSGKTVETVSAEQFINVGLKPNVIDPNTDALVYAGDVFIDSYQELVNASGVPRLGPFGEFHIYQENVDKLVKDFYEAEKPFIDGFSDFTGEGDDEMYRFNLIGGVSSNNVPYHSYQLVTGTANSIRFTENTIVYAQGGTDGTMDDEKFAALVAQEVAEYANANSILQDTARYPESIIYDTGFPLETKYALANFIAIRKDTAVVLGTHVVGGPALTASQESALAIALRTRLQMFPESEFYGTPTMRAMIVGRSGILLNSQYKKRLPLTFEIAVKAAKYMGASNGKWKPGQGFDMHPGSVVELFSDVNVSFTSATVRNKDWANGLVWVESYDLRSLYFPALKTVYDNDTSVLNSFFTMMGCVELQKVGDRIRRKYSGVSHLTNAQLIERVNADAIEMTTGRFDDRFIIQPDAYFTKSDEARGYSWTLVLKIGAPNMKTVMSLSIESYRIEDLQQ